MDLRTVMIVSALLLKTAETDEAKLWPNISETSPSAQTDNKNTSSSPTPASTPRSISVHELGLLTVGWTGECEGDVQLVAHHLSSSPLPVCYDSAASVQTLLRTVCQSKKGCTGRPRWDKGRSTRCGCRFRDTGAEAGTSCETLSVQCTDEELTDLGGQLQAHKVVTALLCCVLVVLLLIRFTRPTIKALQKRLSDRRQNRWIGPTQSHSVSYHRGKTAVKRDDGEKRISYPALEGLMFSGSREPSSNRNSACNF